MIEVNLRHQSLVAWKRADDLFIALHQLASTEFPLSERFELAAQLRRAAYSVPSNIVEGFARRLGYLSQSRFSELETRLNGVGAPLAGLIRAARNASNDISER